MSGERIDGYAKLIASLAETMRDSDWASDILVRCSQIEKAVQAIRLIASRRAGDER